MWAWNMDPVLLVALAAGGGVGCAHLIRSAADPSRRAAFAVVWITGVVAFVSPLCAMTVALFAARSLHHLLLLGVLAPALAFALPWRRPSAGAAFAGLSLALVAWHLPPVYAMAWDHAAVYWILQAAIVLCGWVFWSAALSPAHHMDDALVSGLAVAGLAGLMGLLGAVLTFAPRILYPEHAALTEAFALTPLADQQLAGLVMWVPGMVPMALVSALILRAGWRREAAQA
jgi:putative membrane protein